MVADWQWNDGKRFTGRVVLITGAGGDLGGRCARAFGREGATVALGYRTSSALAVQALQAIKVSGANGHIGWLDVSDEDSVSAFVADTVMRYGRIDVVVNAAARWTEHETLRFEFSNAEDLAKLIDVDVLGTYRVCKAALPHLRATGNGAIVNFGTSFGPGIHKDNPTNFLSVSYCAAKGAIHALTCALARDIAPEVRVNAVRPGVIKPGVSWNVYTDKMLSEVMPTIPLGRMGLHGHIEETVLYLASDGAGFTTGQLIEVNGGWTLDW